MAGSSANNPESVPGREPALREIQAAQQRLAAALARLQSDLGGDAPALDEDPAASAAGEGHGRLFELTSDLLAVVEASGSLLRVNGAWTATLGFESRQLLEWPLAEVIYPDDRDRARRLMVRVAESTEPQRAELRFRRRSGGWRWMSCVVAPDHHEGVFYLAAHDVTRLKETERSLRESEGAIRGLYEIIADRDLDRSLCNLLSFGTHHFGLMIGVIARIEGPNWRVVEICPPDEMSLTRGEAYPVEETFCRDVLRGGEVLALPSVGESAHATHRAFQARRVEAYLGLPLQVDGRAWGTLSFIDLMPRKEPFRETDLDLLRLMGQWVEAVLENRAARDRAESLRERIQQAQRLDSLAVMASRIAHDFNNLLMGILGHADMMRMGLPPDSPYLRSVDQIKSSAQRATDLTRQLAAYSGRGHFRLEPLDLNGLLRQLEPNLRAIRGAGDALRIQPSTNLPPVTADNALLSQIVANLVTNAVDGIANTPGAEIVVRASLCPEPPREDDGFLISEDLADGPFVCLEVRDTGEGMDEATLGRVFDPFFTTRAEARGFGLAATLGIVRSHRGAVSVTSSPGAGCTVRLMLPAATRQTNDADESTASGWRPKGCVLVIDDEAVVRDYVRHVLERLGVEVLEANRGEAGLDLFAPRAAEVGAVLLDMTMPGMDGAAVLRRLRALRPDVPVIVSSGYDASIAEDRFTGENPTGFLQKPYDARQLLKALRRGMGA
ncbi:MAG: response regulator [Sumerlaeia bacterium]